jgi:hypothetical protein
VQFPYSRIPREPAGPSRARRGPRRTAWLSAALASGLMVALGYPLAAEGVASAWAASSTSPSTTTFTFSGAVRGTVHMPNGTCAGSGGQFRIAGRMLKGVKAERWILNVNSPSARGGTWKRFTANASGSVAVSVVLQGETATRDSDWITRSGTMSTAKSSGSLDVDLGPDHSLSGVPGRGTVHVTGSWACVTG